MSQAELAERLGVARQTVHAIENDKFAPSLTLAFKISSLFGADINDVFAPGDGETLPSLLASSTDESAHHHLDDRPARTRPLVYFGKPRADGGR